MKAAQTNRETPPPISEIRIAGHLSLQWADRFEGQGQNPEAVPGQLVGSILDGCADTAIADHTDGATVQESLSSTLKKYKPMAGVFVQGGHITQFGLEGQHGQGGVTLFLLVLVETAFHGRDDERAFGGVAVHHVVIFGSLQRGFVAEQADAQDLS